MDLFNPIEFVVVGQIILQNEEDVAFCCLPDAGRLSVVVKVFQRDVILALPVWLREVMNLGRTEQSVSHVRCGEVAQLVRA